jgi:hypothetical protein
MFFKRARHEDSNNRRLTNLFIFLAVLLVAALVLRLTSIFNRPAIEPAVNIAVVGSANQVPVASAGVKSLLLDTPQPGDLVGNPVTIAGQAASSWFVGGSFLIQIIDDTGQTIGSGLVPAPNNWQADGFVPFTAAININPGTASSGYLLLSKNNPSSLPGYNSSLRISIRFK